MKMKSSARNCLARFVSDVPSTIYSPLLPTIRGMYFSACFAKKRSYVT